MSTPDTRPFSPEQFGEPREYKYISPDTVSEALFDFGIRPEGQFVDAVYVSSDGLRAVGVSSVTEERCEGHFVGSPLLRGVDQVAMMDQTNVLRGFFAGTLKPEDRSRVSSVRNVAFSHPAVPGVILNTGVSVEQDNPLGANAVIMAGSKVVSEGLVRRAVDGNKSTKVLSGGEFPLELYKDAYGEFDEQAVDGILKDYGYGENRRYFTTFLVGDDRSIGIVNYGRDRSGFKYKGVPVFPEHEQIEAAALAKLIDGKLRGEIPEGTVPRFARIREFSFVDPVGLPSTLAVHTFRPSRQGDQGFSRLRCRDKMVSDGCIDGVIVDQKLAEYSLKRARREIPTPKFQLK